jgi:type II secretory pathway pseudopilin PulG
MTGVHRERLLRLLVEGLVIVASILAAFALDRWWESVRARREEQQVLQALDVEFRAARDQLEGTLALHQRILRSVELVREELDRAVRDGSPFVVLPDTSLALLYIPPTTQLTLGTLDGLVGSARLGVIRNAELRSSLASWGSTLDELTEEEWSSRQYVNTELDRAFRVRVNVKPFRWVFSDGTLEAGAMGSTSKVPAEVEILGVVATRYALLDHGIDEFPPVLDELDRLLELIARSRSE